MTKKGHCEFCGWDAPAPAPPLARHVFCDALKEKKYTTVYLHPACVHDYVRRRREERHTDET